MISVLAFLLECGAVAALVGTTLSLVVWPLLALLRRGTLVSSSPLRAELALVLGTLPAAGVLVAVVGATLPSLETLLTGVEDHCSVHLHHLHLCFLHASEVRPVLALGGGIALASVAFRGGLYADRLLRAWARLGALERGCEARREGRFPVVVVPGAPWLCHAAGVFRRRVILSESLGESLAPDELSSALAHEQAHLVRHDPLAQVLLAIAGTLALPPVAREAARAYATAAEEACDTAAVARVGRGEIVASALVKVAALQRRARLAEAAFGAHALEQRVRLLLSPGGPRRIRSAAIWSVGALGALAASVAAVHSETVHHALESLLAHLS